MQSQFHRHDLVSASSTIEIVWISLYPNVYRDCGQARADVLLTGPDANAGSYSTSALAGVADASDNVSSGGLSGITLWGLLGGANASSPTSATYGAITTSTPSGDNGKNAILRYYLLATAANGQGSVVSLDEIDPAFGGTAAVAPVVAFQNGGRLLATPQLVLPGTSGRGLVNLTSLSCSRCLRSPALAGDPPPCSRRQSLATLIPACRCGRSWTQAILAN